MKRRLFIRHAITAVAATPLLSHASGALASAPAALNTWRDSALDATLPKGATLRVVATAGKQAAVGSDYRWHGSPDGGACFATDDGGWIYVSNSELENKQGGAGALRFNAQGEVIDSYPILTGTTRNCAGGATLWGTWLSCEENEDTGLVYECDPYGKKPAKALPALGACNHEAVAMDPITGFAYLTEDKPDGCLYRFRPQRKGDLSEGVLEVAIANGMTLAWQPVPDPSAKSAPMRQQIATAARFRGGEGIVYLKDHIYFSTKVDNRVWSLNLRNSQLAVTYDAALSANPILTGVDNIAISPNGELLIAEDGGDMQLVGLIDNREPVALITLHGQDQSEMTGPAFSPDGRRLYFSSQRGRDGEYSSGFTYELLLPEGLRFGGLRG